MKILGISAYYHDSAAALVVDGRIVAAAQEERFTRIKQDESYPRHAVDYCLSAAGLKVDELDAVAFYEKPFVKFERLLETYLAYAPVGFRSFIKAMPLWLKQKLWIKSRIQSELGYKGTILFPEHHESHAASAFFPSPFEEAAVLTIDGVGEWATTTYGTGRGNTLELTNEIRFPHSLGLFYSAFTYYLGFKVNSGEYKVMGLAPYGEPKYVDLIRKELIDIKDDGSFQLNLRYYNYPAGLTMTNSRFDQLFGAPPRKSEDKLTQRDMDIARSLQVVTEEIVLKMGQHIAKTTGMKKLCLAGGVALNCVANGKLLKSGVFDEIWIQPAAGDAGGALGAALAGYYLHAKKERKPRAGRDEMQGGYLGPAFSDGEIEAFLTKNNLPYERLSSDAIATRGAQLLADAKVVGWFQGRMEFGPRALGARSILGDARNREMQKTLNLKIKYRESFRPFAPSVLREKVADWFDLDADSPYMLLTTPINPKQRIAEADAGDQLSGLAKLGVPRSTIPAVTHVDDSARVQTVHRETNPLYYSLIEQFERLTGCPVIINTSFNVRGEPIVCTPEDAYRCLMRTEMDYLLMGSFLIDKTRQPKFHDTINWKETFELD